MGMEDVWLIPLFPLAAFAILALFRNVLPRQGDWVSVLAILASFIVFFPVAADLLDKVGTDAVPGRWVHEWMGFADYRLNIGFMVDEITIVMLAVVTGVGLLIQVYSLGYMKGEAHYGWFFTAMSLFVFAMLTLVLADNFLMLYVAWELVGLCSYLLIGFYWERRSAAEAAKKAFVTTRIGDVGLLIGIILLWRKVGTFDMTGIFDAAQSGQIENWYLTLSGILIFMGAVGKSAQFPLHVWLPDAMEGPTPVSALIHAATMVVAGVYLVARAMPLLDVAPHVLQVVTGLGVVTVLISAGMGLVMTDLKRVVAYSTINSLGLMMVALGSGSVTAAMLYLLAHGFFKALLFMAAGSVLHATEQTEVTSMGGLWRKMPITGTVFAIGALAMAGIPPLAGFWAKDEILAAVNEHQNVGIYILMAISVIITALYMTRVFVLAFMGQPRDHHAYEHAHEAPPIMTVPNVILAVFAVVAGFVVFSGIGKAVGLPGGFGEFVFFHEAEAFKFHVDVGLASIILAALGVVGGLYIWWAQEGRPARQAAAAFPALYALLKNKFYMDDIYQAMINRVVLVVAGIISWFDRSIVNDTGVDGSAFLARFTGYVLKFQQTGRLPNYALVMVIGVVALALAAYAIRG